MKRTRKFLALLLALVMTLSLLPTAAFAATTEPAGETNAFDGVDAYLEQATAAEITESGTYMIWVNTANHWMHYGTTAVNGCGSPNPGDSHGAAEAHTSDSFDPSDHQWVVEPVDGVENGFHIKSVAAGDTNPYITVTTSGDTHTLGFGAADAAATFTIAPVSDSNNYTFKWTYTTEGDTPTSTDYYLGWSSGFVLQNTSANTARFFKPGRNPLKSIPGYTRITTTAELEDGFYMVVAPGSDGNYYVLRPYAWGGNATVLAAQTYRLTLDENNVVDGVTGAETAALSDMAYQMTYDSAATKWLIKHGELRFGPSSSHNLWHNGTNCVDSNDEVYITRTEANGGSFKIHATASGGIHLLLLANNTFGGSSTTSGRLADFLFFKRDGVVKDVLKAAIDTADALEQNDYTEESWPNLADPLAHAKEVYGSDAATQEDVDAAADTLQAAIDALVFKPLTIEGYTQVTAMPEGGLEEGYYLIMINRGTDCYVLYPGGTGGDAGNARKLVLGPGRVGTALKALDGSGNDIALATAHNRITQTTGTQTGAVKYHIAAVAASDTTAGNPGTIYEFAIADGHILYHVQGDLVEADNVTITENAGQGTFAFVGSAGQYFGLNAAEPHQFWCSGTASNMSQRDVLLFKYTGVDKSFLQSKVTDIGGAVEALTESDYTAETWQALEDALAEGNRLLTDSTATQAQVDEATDALIAARAGLALAIDPHALPGYHHKNDTSFSATKRYLVVSWDSADNAYALYFNNGTVGAGALPTAPTTTNVSPITLTGEGSSKTMTFGGGENVTEADVRYAILAAGSDKYYIRNGENYLSLGDHIFEPAATALTMTLREDESVYISSTANRWLTLSVNGDAASDDRWRNLGTAFWGPTAASAVMFPVLIYESDADFEEAAMPAGSDIIAHMLSADPDNTWAFVGGRAVEGTYADIALSRTAASHFEEYVRWSNTGGTIHGRQRYVFNTAYEGQTLADIVSESGWARVSALKPKAVVYAVGPEDMTASDTAAITTFKEKLGTFIDKALTVRNTTTPAHTEDTYAVIVKPYLTGSNSAAVTAFSEAIDQVVAEKVAAVPSCAAKIKAVSSSDFSESDSPYVNAAGYPTAKGQLKLSYQLAKEAVGCNRTENSYPCANDYAGLYDVDWPGELEAAETAGTVTLDPTYADARAAIAAKVANTNTPMTWIFMGDSITHGAAWSEGQDTISQLFEKFVKNDLGRDKDVVLNTAVSSANSDDENVEGTRHYISYRLNNYNADVVSIMIGTNDASNHLIPVDKYKVNIAAIIDAILAKDAIAVLRTPIPNNNGGRGGNMHEYVTAMKEVVNALTPEKKAKVIVVDQFPEWVPYVMTSETGTGTTFLYNKVFTRNSLHPGPVGHLWMTQEFIRDLGLWRDSTICKLHYHQDASEWNISPVTNTTVDLGVSAVYNPETHELAIPMGALNNGGTIISATVTATVGGTAYTSSALRGAQSVTIDLTGVSDAALADVTLAATSLVSVSTSEGNKVTFTTREHVNLTGAAAIPEIPAVPANANKHNPGDTALLPPGHDEVTNGQPFNDDVVTDTDGVAGSRKFRIPAMIVLKHQQDASRNGTIVTAMDARWNHGSDAYGLDTMVAISTNDGQTWSHQYANYFADSAYGGQPRRAAVFIDPVLAEGKDGTIYMMTDLFPGGVATLTAYGVTPAADSGYRDITLNNVTKKRMVLYTMTDGVYSSTGVTKTRLQTNDNWTYFVGDFVALEGTDNKYATIYNSVGVPTELYVDEYYYLYKKTGSTMDPDNDRIYCPQILNSGWNSNSTTEYVQQNVFFFNSILHVRCASYLWVVKSTDGGQTWSKPVILNDQVRYDPAPDQFYGVGPGGGLTMEYGALAGMVLLPTYIHGGTAGEISEFIYTRDGVNWDRSQRTTNHGAGTGGWSSESCLVQIGEYTVRHFYRDGSNDLHYTDHTWNTETESWVAGSQYTVADAAGGNARKTSGNQLAAILYSQKIDGKDAIILSTANSTGGNRRHGCLYVLLLEDDAARTITKTYEYEVNGLTDEYSYATIAETKDGDIADLYECASYGGRTTFKIIPIETVADGGVVYGETAHTQQITVPLYNVRSLNTNAAALTALETQLADESLVACTVGDGTATMVGMAPGEKEFTYTLNGKTVNVTVKVEGTADRENVTLTRPTTTSKVVEGLPVDTQVDYNSNSAVVTATTVNVTEGISVTNGAKAKRHDGTSYNGTVVDLVGSLYTFTSTGETGQFYVQSISNNALYLNISGTAKRPNGAKEAITVADNDSNVADTFTLRAGSYLYCGASSAVPTVHFDRNGSYAAPCAFYLYRPANAGEAASTEMPGFVKVTDVSGIESGKQYLIVGKASNNYYVLYPSAENNDFASCALVDAANTANQTLTWPVSVTLTIAAAANNGQAVVMAGGKRYDVTVTGGDASEAPVITITTPAAPETVALTEGETLSLTVTAAVTESATLSYQWKKDGTAIDGANTATYTKANVTTADSATYTCEVSATGAETKVATFTVTVNSETDLSEEKAAVEGTAYTTTQAACADQDAAKAVINAAVEALNLPEGVTATVNFLEYTAPTAGTADDPDGTNGSYTFTVTLTAEGATVTTETLTLTITATAYTAPAPTPGGNIRPAQPSTPEPTVTENPDGSTTTTVTAPDGTVTETTETPDGTVTEKVSSPEEGVTITVTDAEGEVEVQVTIPATIPEVAEENRFVDVPEGHWADQAIHEIASLGMVNGVDETEHVYDMTSSMTRGTIATVLYRFSHGTEGIENIFGDVAEGQWYTDGVSWAAKTGVVTGYDDGSSFGPDDVITREQMATMLARYAGLIGLDTAAEDTELDAFADGAETSAWAASGIAWCVKAGILQGKGGNVLDPKANITRAEAAVMLQRFIELIK